MEDQKHQLPVQRGLRGKQQHSRRGLRRRVEQRAADGVSALAEAECLDSRSVRRSSPLKMVVPSAATHKRLGALRKAFPGGPQAQAEQRGCRRGCWTRQPLENGRESPRRIPNAGGCGFARSRRARRGWCVRRAPRDSPPATASPAQRPDRAANRRAGARARRRRAAHPSRGGVRLRQSLFSFSWTVWVSRESARTDVGVGKPGTRKRRPSPPPPALVASFSAPRQQMANPIVFFDISIGGQPAGRIEMVCTHPVAARTAALSRLPFTARPPSQPSGAPQGRRPEDRWCAACPRTGTTVQARRLLARRLPAENFRCLCTGEKVRRSGGPSFAFSRRAPCGR